MRNSTIIVCFLVAATFAVLPACGGGGNGFSIDGNTLTITSNSIDPNLVSGDAIDWEIPLNGGCSGVGPFVVEVISGQLPDGVGVDDADGRHHLVGFILEDGAFRFTIKITDTSCVPFSTTNQQFDWQVAQGPVRIVASNPPLIPNAQFDDPLKYDPEPGDDIDALETVVYGSFVNYDLIVAGGVGPYSCVLIDDPDDPDDGALPLGLSFAVNSCSLIGTPTEVGPAGRPFRYTVRVTDATGATSTRKFQHKIDTPPIIIPNTALLPGQAGKSYTDGVTAVDGVPPIAYELTDNVPDDDGSVDTTNNVNDNIDFTPGMTPTVLGYVEAGLDFQFTATGPTDLARLNSGAGRVDYPAENALGPDYTNNPFPPEGIYFREKGPGNGGFFGVPRRRGQFLINVHAYSTLVPNERGQHAFKQLPFDVSPADPLAMDPSFTLEGEIPTSATEDGKSSIAEAELTVIYNPDSAVHPPAGLEFLAVGGVAFDNKNDQPHEDDLGPPVPVERVDKYKWSANMNYDGNGAWGSVPDAMDFYDDFGIFGTGTNGVADQAKANSLFRGSRRLFQASVTDHSLPLQVRPGAGTAPPVTNEFGMSVGPDTVIVTASDQSFSGTTTSGSAQTDMHDQEIRIKAFSVIGGSGSLSDLSASDLSEGTTIPAEAGAGQTLKSLLSDLESDLLRVAVNPNGWWNDSGNMNPKAARSASRNDPNVGRAGFQVSGAWQNGGGWQQGASDVDLPETPTVTANLAAGIRNDGGRMFAFQNQSHFGFFIIRKNASIYIPWMTLKGNTASGVSAQKFGDGIQSTGKHAALIVCPISVSPDGRICVAKILNTTSTSMSTQLTSTRARFVLFTLTGEKFANGRTYTYVHPNTSSSNGGNYTYSTSMTLTNSHLYFLSGDYTSTYSSWRDHWISRFTFANSSGTLTADDSGGAELAQLANGVGANWKQTSSVAMSTPFHKYDNTVRTTSTFTQPGFVLTSVQYPDSEMYLFDGWNMSENTLAPVPFRVSADGKHCALLAGDDANTTSGSGVMAFWAWVDSGTASGFRQISSNTKRHAPNGAARGYSLRRGPSSYRHWGRYSGPTTAFEISDDGRNVAYVYNTAGSVSATSTSHWNNNREDLIAIRTNNGGSDPWTSTTGEKLVTEKTFGGTLKWRFGSLVFTEDNDGLIFWGGASSRDANSSNGTGSGYPPGHVMHYLGTYYAYDMTSGGSGTGASVRGIMPTTAGGIGSFPTYTGNTPFSPAVTVWAQAYGLIKPLGGFLSKNRKYFYVVSMHPLGTSDQTPNVLVGINIEDLSGNSTPSGHNKGRGFKPGNWPSRRGFLPNYYYQPYYGLGDNGMIPHHSQGGGLQSMNRKTGYVYFMSHYSTSGPTRSSSTSTFSAGPAIAMYWNDQGYKGMHVEGFHADVGGPIQRLTHAGLGGDSSNRGGHFLSSSEDGTQLAYVYTTSGQTRNHGSESIGMVRGIRFNSTTGVYEGGGTGSQYAFKVESGSGRIGEAVAFDSGGTKLFYAFKSGSSNENFKDLVQLTVNPSTGVKTYNRTVRVGSLGRFNVLYAGR